MHGTHAVGNQEEREPPAYVRMKVGHEARQQPPPPPTNAAAAAAAAKNTRTRIEFVSLSVTSKPSKNFSHLPPRRNSDTLINIHELTKPVLKEKNYAFSPAAASSEGLTSAPSSPSTGASSDVQRVRLSRSSCMMRVESLYDSSERVSSSAIASSNA